MYTVEEFNNYMNSQRGTGRTMRMIEKAIAHVKEDPENNIPEIVVMYKNQVGMIESILKESGVEKAEFIITDESRRLYGMETTATFIDHSVAEYNIKNALMIYEKQIGDSQ